MELASKIISSVDQVVEKIRHRICKTTENVETIASTIPSNVMVHVQKANLLVEDLAEQTLHTT